LTTLGKCGLVVRRQFAAFADGLDAVEEYWHRNIDWRAAEGAADDVGVMRGSDALRRYYEEWIDTFDELHAEVEAVIFESPERCAAVVRNRGRPRGTDAEVGGRYFVVCTVRDGRIASGREYLTQEEALDAAMSENTKIVQAVGDAYFRGDEKAMLEFVDRDVVVTQFADQPDARPYHGHEGMLRAITEWVDTWDDYAIEFRSVRELGNEVLFSLHQRGRGKASGIELEADVFFVYSVRDGKVVRWQMFPSEAEALEAAQAVVER
jgi:ketosteroid isomerase-like protein